MSDSVAEKENKGNVESGDGGLPEVPLLPFQCFPYHEELDSEKYTETKDQCEGDCECGDEDCVTVLLGRPLTSRHPEVKRLRG